MNSTKLIFKSRPSYLWVIAIIGASIFVPLINHHSYTIEHIVISSLMIYIVSIFSVRSFNFYATHFNRIYPARFGFIKRNTRFDYSELFVVEVRNRKEPYQRPYVIFHFNENKMKSKFFSHRAFIYKNIKELTPLLKCLVEQNVKVKVNMTKEFKDDYDKIVGLIGGNQYKSNAH